MTNNQDTKIYDLEKRTAEFGKRVIRLCRSLDKDIVNLKLIDQLVRSSTSVGANYREANEFVSKKDFVHRVGICMKEIKESEYWLEMVIEANPAIADKTENLIDESKQLIRIFAAILEKSKKF